VAAPRCDQVFLDVGSGNGRSIKAFMSDPVIDAKRGLEPRNHPQTLAQKFEGIRAHLGAENKSNWCVFAFEGVSHFTPKLKELQERYRPWLRQILIYTSQVLTNADGPALLYVDHSSSRPDGAAAGWRSSLNRGHLQRFRETDSQGLVALGGSGSSALDTEVEEQVVVGQTLKGFFSRHVAPSATFVMHIDVQGAEYFIIRDAFQSGLLCGLAAAATARRPEAEPALPQQTYKVLRHRRASTCGIDGFLSDGEGIYASDEAAAQASCSREEGCMAYMYGPSRSRGLYRVYLCASVPVGVFNDDGWQIGINFVKLRQSRQQFPRVHLIIHWHPYMAKAYGQPPGIEHEYNQLLLECNVKVHVKGEYALSINGNHFD